MKSRFISIAAGLAALLFSALPGQAVTTSVGINPVSSSGNFSFSPGGTTFTDQVTFDLVGAPTWFAIASATNTFADAIFVPYQTSPNYITNFMASLYQIVGIIGGGDDIQIIAPVAASLACGGLCQNISGSAFLQAGSYYAEFTGQGGGTSGYSGNLSAIAAPIPIPAALPMFGAALGGIVWLKRRSGKKNLAV